MWVGGRGQSWSTTQERETTYIQKKGVECLHHDTESLNVELTAEKAR